ncbi:MAG: hypothetical protein KGI66_03825, partial [Patescibacteria group bacterium]|nr:hypothetical protein [Patescibacteria group bacterium]
MKKYLLIAISLMISAPAALAQSSTPAPAYTLLAPAPEQNYTLLAPIPCIPSPDKKQLDSAGNMVTIPGVKCPGNGTTIQNQDSVTFSDYLQEAINLMIALASVAAVFMIVWGGFEYMASAIPGVKTDGLKKVQNALVGLVLILASYL